MKAAFLDRDGTINKSFWTHEHEGGPEFWAGSEEPELLDGALAGMRHLTASGYSIIIITNQYPIGEGQITQEFYDRFTARLLALLKEGGVDVLDVFYCPHRRDEGCACCKPRPGMIEQALRKYPSIDLSQSFFTGDSAADEGVARACGLPFYGVGRDGGQRIDSLGDLVRFIGRQPESISFPSLKIHAKPLLSARAALAKFLHILYNCAGNERMILCGVESHEVRQYRRSDSGLQAGQKTESAGGRSA